MAGARLLGQSWPRWTRRVLSAALLGALAAASTIGAAECLSVAPYDRHSVALSLTQADAVPGSLRDALLVRTGGELGAVEVEIAIEPLAGGDGLRLESLRLGPFLPSSGFPVLWLDAAGGEPQLVVEGQELPIERLIAGDDPRVLWIQLAVDGPGGGFAGAAPEPLVILDVSGAAGDIRIKRLWAAGPDGGELTALLEVADLCLRPACEAQTALADELGVDLALTAGEVEPGSHVEGLLIQTAGEVQSGNFELFYDPLILECRGLRAGGSLFVREDCPLVFVPASGPDEIIAAPAATIPAERILRQEGHILFGLASPGPCAPAFPAPPGPDGPRNIATLDFNLRSAASRRDDIVTGIRPGPATALFGPDGPAEFTFVSRTGACYRFPGRCDARLACAPTPDSLGTALSWENDFHESVALWRDGFLLATLGPGTREYVDPLVRPGSHRYELAGTIEGLPCAATACVIEIPPLLLCPEALSCALHYAPETGEPEIALSWRNGEVYDLLELKADGQPVPISGPTATAARIALERGTPMPGEFTLVAGRSGQRCEPLRCALVPACHIELVCSELESGRIRLDWSGSGGLLSVEAVDRASGRRIVLVQDQQVLSSLVVPPPLGGQGTRYEVRERDPANGQLCGSATCTVGAPEFRRGDVNADGFPNRVEDALANLLWLFAAGPEPRCLGAADLNADGANDVADPIYGLFAAFAGGPPPLPPFPGCGPDLDPRLSCASYASCRGAGAFPGAPRCTLDAGAANLLVSWVRGQDLAALALRLGTGARQPLEPSAIGASIPLAPEDYGRTLVVILEAQLRSGSALARSCVVAIPPAPPCPAALRAALLPEAGTLGHILVAWEPSGASVTQSKDSGLTRSLGPNADSAMLPIEAADLGRVVSIDLRAVRPFGGLCLDLSTQVEVPLPPACFGPLHCEVDAPHGSIEVSWTAGRGLSGLEIQRGSAAPVRLRGDADHAVLPLAEEDYGTSVTVTLRSPGSTCAAQQCTVAAPPAPLRCFAELGCAVDLQAGLIRASWSPAENLAALELEKDGVLLQTLPPDARALDVAILEADHGRTLNLTLRGFDAEGVLRCESSCPAYLPPTWPPECRPAQEVFLGSSIFGRNDAPGHTLALEQYRPTGVRRFLGPEYAYGFAAAASETLLVRLTQLSGDLDLFVVQHDDAGACKAEGCFAASASPGTGDEALAISVAAGRRYSFVVDSLGPIAQYRLEVQPLVEASCPNLLGSLACDGGAQGGRNDAFGGASQRLTYGCDPQLVWEGPEVAYSLRLSAQVQRVTVLLSALEADLDLFVVESRFGLCDAARCVARSWNAGASDEALIFRPTPGQEYAVVVDGYAGAVSDFQLAVACSLEPRFLRGDANGDGKVDLADAILLGSALGQPELCRCLDACDADDDGALTLDDVRRIQTYLFGFGPAPPPPFSACGTDPSGDALPCAAYDRCP